MHGAIEDLDYSNSGFRGVIVGFSALSWENSL